MKINHKEFKTLGESNAWAKSHGFIWYTNFCGDEEKVISGLKVRSSGEQNVVLVTKIGVTKQAFYK